jgi:hypothetical protein
MRTLPRRIELEHHMHHSSCITLERPRGALAQHQLRLRDVRAQALRMSLWEFNYFYKSARSSIEGPLSRPLHYPHV